MWQPKNLLCEPQQQQPVNKKRQIYLCGSLTPLKARSQVPTRSHWLLITIFWSVVQTANIRCDCEFSKDPVVSLQRRWKHSLGSRWAALPQYFSKSFWRARRRSQSKSLKKPCRVWCWASAGGNRINAFINSTVGRASFGQDGFILGGGEVVLSDVTGLEEDKVFEGGASHEELYKVDGQMLTLTSLTVITEKV